MSYQYFDELPDDGKERSKNKLSLLDKIASIYYFICFYFSKYNSTCLFEEFDTKCWSKLKNVDLICILMLSLFLF